MSFLPGSIIEFDGSPSFDPNPGEQIGGYTVRAVSTPDASSLNLDYSGSSPIVTTQLDVEGDYTFEVGIQDEGGLEECGVQTVSATAESFGAGLRVELRWENSDMEFFDINSVDMDLHYKHPLGSWDKLPYDVYWNNMEPDFGVPGVQEDNPRLLAEVTQANLSPEVLVHANLEEGYTYDIAVYSYNIVGIPATVHVDIYWDNVLVIPRQTRAFNTKDMFWHVASVDSTAQVTIVDTTQQGFPR